jgi:hypothetical protein
VLLNIFLKIFKKERVHSPYYPTFYDLSWLSPSFTSSYWTHWNIQVQGRSCPIALHQEKSKSKWRLKKQLLYPWRQFIFHLTRNWTGSCAFGLSIVVDNRGREAYSSQQATESNSWRHVLVLLIPSLIAANTCSLAQNDPCKLSIQVMFHDRLLSIPYLKRVGRGSQSQFTMRTAGSRW